MNGIWSVVLPIGIGSLIGYCTNYIAIKMLFRPRKAIKIGNWTLPFTPGIIPKNQPRIARAVGNAVGENLFTQNDILGVLKSDDLKETIAEEAAREIMKPELTLKSCVTQISPFSEEETMEKLNLAITEKIVDGAKQIDFADLIMHTAGPLMLEKVKGSMLAMFINEGTIQNLATPIGEAIYYYLNDKGNELVKPLVEQKVEETLEGSVADTVTSMNGDYEYIKKAVGDLYGKAAEEKAADLLRHLPIAKLVEEKVNEMDVQELEDLVMSVMKQELQAVVNLGAVIGAVIAILNVFI